MKAGLTQKEKKEKHVGGALVLYKSKWCLQWAYDHEKNLVYKSEKEYT